MADQKISELTEKTVIVADDLLAIVDSEASPIETKKVKRSNLVGFNSRVRAYRSDSAQSISNSTWTKMQLNSEDFDNLNEFDSTTNYRFTATVASIYFGALAAAILSVADGTFMGLSVRKNGAANGITDVFTTPGAAGDAGISTPFIAALAANDYLEFYVYQNSGSSKNLAYESVGRLTWMFIICLVRTG